jgi:cobaltochelatase CobN
MKQLKLAFMTTIPSDAAPLISAVESLNKKFGETVNVKVVAELPPLSTVPLEEFIEFAVQSHITVVHLMSEVPEFDRLVLSLKKAGVPLFVGGSFFVQNKKYEDLSTVEPDDYRKIFMYVNHNGKKNFENLLLYLSNTFLGTNYEVEPFEHQRWEGIYHPDFDYVPALDEYIKEKFTSGRPTIGIWLHHNHWQSGDTQFAVSLIREIERQDANVLPVFFSGTQNIDMGVNGFDWVVDRFFVKDGKPLVDAVISAQSFSLSMSSPGSEALDALKKLGVPVLKAVLTVNTFETWRDSIQGLNVLELAPNVAMPEFDGFLITVPIAAMTFSQTNPLTGARIIQYAPIPERINKLVRLTINWAKLRHIPNGKKKVAIIFHNYPPRNDTIGKAFAIDTAVSILKLLNDMKTAGYKIADIPQNGQVLMDTLINGLTNDRRWLNAEELAKRAVAKIPLEKYSRWFNDLPIDVQEKMEKHWGKPPGKVFSYRGNLLVAGLMNANVFIGLQPPRGFLDDPASIYHSPDLPIPHHYYAYYRWIQDVFKADVIIHVGTHGSLEWLPGKSVGLSESCFPDITIADLPNVYPYVITNPGEGTQAKRRSYCCIIDYLIPVMHNADSYEELAALEVQLQEYYSSKASADQEKLPVLQKLIWEKVAEAKLDSDLEITQDTAFNDFEKFLERLHGYLHELADSQIRDGLHVLGEPPAGSRLDEFLVTLTRLSNGAVPSLRQSIAEQKGYDYEDLLANKGKLRPEGRTNGDVINEINGFALKLMEKFDAAGFNEQSVDAVALEVLGEISPNVRRCLTYIAVFLVPALAKTTDELTNILAACEGKFVPPGPSGSITRGMADILPTGRNFFSVDPRAIPTRAAWRVGVALGDALLERHLKETGKYPESIGIILWAIPTMKTSGDDVAEILYLMGMKPVWEESSGRVAGLEVIPLDELKRPRIDVTVRISGLFRDTFPNVVHLIDDAVTLAASLKESAEKNYIAKHVETEVKERTDKGVDAEQAKEEACFRIFGDRPAAYGCGVSDAIDSKNWKDQKDLSDVYVVWGSYVYSRKRYGISVPDQFKLRLSKLDLAVKNDDSREYDLFDDDGWYDALGGMVTATKTFGGKPPKSYLGDSSDPDRVKVRSTAEETCHVFRSRLLNPKYIQSVKRYGYHGAAELSRMFDFVFGWDATVEVVEDWMYEGLAKKYVLDQDMQQWLKDVNPYALQNMTERLLEAIERGLWQANEEMKKQLQQIYLQIEGLLESEGEKK